MRNFNRKYKIKKTLLHICFGLCFLYELNLLSEITKFSNDGFLNVPLRGNAVDIHFTNLTASKLSVNAFYFDNKAKVPELSKRNILFIPNNGDISITPELPLSFSLAPAVLYKSKHFVLKGQSFIQGIVIYNNLSSYQDKILYNGGYNRDEQFATYSAFMWSHGIRAPDDGTGVFKNAMNEINNLKYKLRMRINKDLQISLDLNFKTVSNLKTEDKSLKIPEELKRLRNINVAAAEIAAFTKMAGGIVNILTNPPAGILITISGAFNEVQALTLYMINTYVGEHLINQTVKGESWLSSPFNILVKPEKFYIKNSEGKVLDIADYNIQNSKVIFYLGNNIKPQFIEVQLSASDKGDLFINFISSSLIKNNNPNNFSNTNEFNIKNI